ncbi:phosphoinositide-3-kinase-interacting protein 1-like [Anolis carolinensis]|uniref:phosphoinositide-3-kinase-interacting protein 1-like n=1 Tax=Anolis carolinensis TaxID=28377 RepID=UPI002F2B43C9
MLLPAEAALALSLLALTLAGEEESSTPAGVRVSPPSGSPGSPFGPALEILPPPSRGEVAAVEPVIGRGPAGGKVAGGRKPKKDLGVMGYVLGLIMVVIIIAIGLGIVVGYVYKRGRDLRSVRERKAQERERQRATLPLSAFVNRACEEAGDLDNDGNAPEGEAPPACEEASAALEAGEGPSSSSSHLVAPQAGTPGA